MKTFLRWPPSSGGAGRAAVVVLVFVALTLIHLWPLAQLIATHNTPNTDTAISLWWVSQMSRQMIANPLRLFDGNVFSPHPYTLAVVDHMIVTSLAAIPLWVVTHNPILVHNVSLLATFALSGIFTAFLVRRLSGSWWAGVIAGVAFAFCAFRWYELPHLHILTTQWIPLALLALDRLIERPSGWRAAGFAAAAIAVALSSWHAAIVGGMLIGVVAVYAIAQRRTISRRHIVAIAGVALLVALVVAPITVPYRYTGRWVIDRTQGERQRGLARHSLSVGELLPPAIVLGPPPVNAHGNARVTWAFAGLMTWGLAACAFIPDWRREVRGPIAKPLVAAGTLAGAFLGVIVVALQRGYAGQPALAAMLAPMSPVVVLTVALALFAWFLARRQALDESDLADAAKFRRARLIYAIVAIGGLLLALGPRAVVGGISLGAGLYQPSYFPPFGVLRAPERFGLWFAFGLAVLAGLGTARLVSLLPRAPAVLAAVVLLVLLNVDLRPAPIDLGTEDPPGPGHYRLATLPEPGSVFELPGERWKLALLGAFEHGRPVVNGVGYVSPPGYTEMRGLRQLGQERLDILWEHFHPRLIMVRGRFYDAAARARVFEAVDKRKDAITIIEEAGEDIILRLKDRGRGPALPRRWPRASLEKAEGLQFSAIVTGGREDRIDRLTLSLNDHLVLELEGRAAADPENRRVPIRPEWLVPYENRFNVRADYRYRPGQPAHPIGKTNVSVAADVQLRADGRLAWYQVNGDRREVAPGYTLVALDAATGAVRSRMSFDTGRGAAASARLAQFVATLPDATPVLVVSEGQTSSRLTDDAVAALRGLGLRQDPRTRRAVHAAIGVKGAAVGSVPEQVHRSRTEISLGTPEHREVQLDGFDLY